MAAAALVLAVGCQELPNYFVGDETLARVGRTELTVRDVLSAVPAGMNEADSTAFVDLYVDRWVRKQLKLGEAERLFTASAEDIDRMVEEYRQGLLIRKLDRFWVDRSIDTTFTDDEIAAYYREHLDDFRLDRTLVKGCCVSTRASARPSACSNGWGRPRPSGRRTSPTCAPSTTSR